MDGTDWTATAARIEAAWPGTLADPDREARYRTALRDLDRGTVEGVLGALAGTGRMDPPPPGFIRTVAMARAQHAASAAPMLPAPADHGPVGERPWAAPRAPDRPAVPPVGTAAIAVLAFIAAAIGALSPWMVARIPGITSKGIDGTSSSEGKWLLAAAAAGAVLVAAGLWLGLNGTPRKTVVSAFSLATAAATFGGLQAWWAHNDIVKASDQLRELAQGQLPDMAARLPAAMGVQVDESTGEAIRQAVRSLEVGFGWGFWMSVAGLAVGAAAAIVTSARVTRAE